jgi:translation initiation factor IF-2
MGGDVLCIEVSAKTKKNLDKLIDAILLQAELLEVKANPDCKNASGVVIESRIDKNKGVISTLLVNSGTLKVGDILVAGSAYGKVRVMNNDKGQKVKALLPAEPAEIMGLNEAAESGQQFYVVDSEKVARDIIQYRIKKNRDIEVARKSKKTLKDIFSDMSSDKVVELPLIVKADVKGSVEAIISSVEKCSNDEVKIKIVHSGVGGITESDIILAKASNAMILGFNVRMGGGINDKDKEDVDVRYYSIIYDLIDEIKSISNGMLKPLLKEVELGKGEIRQVFDLSKYGKVAGSYINSGIAKRSGKCRVIRDSIVVSDGVIKAIKHYKNDVSEVKNGSECGISFENFTSFQEGDLLEFYEVIEEKRK